MIPVGPEGYRVQEALVDLLQNELPGSHGDICRVLDANFRGWTRRRGRRCLRDVTAVRR